jgi:hypothetical protein
MLAARSRLGKTKKFRPHACRRLPPRRPHAPCRLALRLWASLSPEVAGWAGLSPQPRCAATFPWRSCAGASCIAALPNDMAVQQRCRGIQLTHGEIRLVPRRQKTGPAIKITSVCANRRLLTTTMSYGGECLVERFRHHLELHEGCLIGILGNHLSHLLDRGKEMRHRARDLVSHVYILQYVVPTLDRSVIAYAETLVQSVPYTGQSSYEPQKP